jgi:tripartite-type tricarboxylate transporter receptor subunit TctC
MIKIIHIAILVWLALTNYSYAQVLDYPNRSIKILVPLAAGSGTDSAARYFGQQLATLLGQSVVIENRPGANGMIAGAAVKAAPADGYTVFLGTLSPLGLNELVMKGPFPYNAITDFKPVSGLTRGMGAFVVPGNSPFKTLAELVTAAKQSPRPFNVGTYATSYQLTLDWFNSLSGVKFVGVPYKGAAPIFTDLIGNQLDWAVLNLSGASTLLLSGKLRAVAVTGDTRAPEFPDIPTVKESGYPEYSNYLWTSLYVRTETPEHITNKLSAAMQRVLTSPQAQEYLVSTGGGELMPLGPTQMRKMQLDEVERFREIIKTSGFKPE